MMKLTKEQYVAINRVYLVSDINKTLATKSGFKTAKEMKEAFKHIEAKRKERSNRKWIAGMIERKQKHDSAHGKYQRLRAMQIVHFANPSHHEENVVFGNEFSIKYEKELDYNMYSQRYGHPGTIHKYYITLPSRGCKMDYSDGMTMVVVKTETKLGITYKKGYLLKKKGCCITPVPCVLLSNGIFSAHGTDFNDAKKNLRKKIRNVNRKKRVVNPIKDIRSLDDKINAATYQEITGACNIGTNEWLSEHGYTRRNVITVRELLNELSDYDYGKKIFIEYLKKNGVVF